jgi:ABC-type nitrate/sulfonate/bicarbonate transport system substrate-binding protein
MTLTYKEALTFINVGREFLSIKGQKASALTYALNKTIKSLEKHKEEFEELVAELKDKYQKKDKEGVFEFHDEKNTIPKFTAENHSAFRKQFNELKNKEFEFEPYFASAIPSDLDIVWYEYFVPIVIEDYPKGDN